MVRKPAGNMESHHVTLYISRTETEQEQYDIPTSPPRSLLVATGYTDSDIATRGQSDKERERKTSFEDAVSETKKRLLNVCVIWVIYS